MQEYGLEWPLFATVIIYWMLLSLFFVSIPQFLGDEGESKREARTPLHVRDNDGLTMAGRERTVESSGNRSWTSCVCGPPGTRRCLRPTAGEKIRAIRPSPSTATGRRGTSVRSLTSVTFCGEEYRMDGPENR
jgi:hypothetical protein